MNRFKSCFLLCHPIFLKMFLNESIVFYCDEFIVKGLFKLLFTLQSILILENLRNRICCLTALLTTSSEDFGNAIDTTGSECTSLSPTRSESDDAQSDEDHETKEESCTLLKHQSEKVHNESDTKKGMIFPFAPDINC